MMSPSCHWKLVVATIACLSLLGVVAYMWICYGASNPPTINPLSSPQASADSVPQLARGSRTNRSQEAYVALFYGGFFSAMRVLGQSLRESGTTRDYVALCLASVRDEEMDILMRDGWIVKTVNPLPKECVGNVAYSKHFTKIQAWQLTEYRRVISIDSDAIVLHNIDHLFNCGEFCVSYRHSDLFNTGVVVLKPSLNTFKDMCKHIQSIGSYTGGDQGFLNYYYEQLKYAPMFSRYNQSNQHSKFLRLPSEYNGDVSVYYLNNKWMYIDVEEPYVLHYTLGPVKPWKWWSYPLFSLNWRWKSLHDRLPPADVREPSLWDWQSWLPLPLLIALYLSSRMWCGWYSRVVNQSIVIKVAQYLGLINGRPVKLLPVLLLALACHYAYSHVPLAMSPLEAWTRYGAWILLYFLVPYSAYCHLAYITGKNTTTSGTTVNHCRVLIECSLWLLLAMVVFYMQVLLPPVFMRMKYRAIVFISLGVSNVLLCYFYGRRLIHLWFQLGSLSPNSVK